MPWILAVDADDHPFSSIKLVPANAIMQSSIRSLYAAADDEGRGGCRSACARKHRAEDRRRVRRRRAPRERRREERRYKYFSHSSRGSNASPLPSIQLRSTSTTHALFPPLPPLRGLLRRGPLESAPFVNGDLQCPRHARRKRLAAKAARQKLGDPRLPHMTPEPQFMAEARRTNNLAIPNNPLSGLLTLVTSDYACLSHGALPPDQSAAFKAVDVISLIKKLLLGLYANKTLGEKTMIYAPHHG
ncbi:hypothetical protein C8J57DRAFT_1637700 [Mycena rebaudengoi]|nr:hypothetical protein C8J57DRAFT_1637700 [Mycena rebaudengoi]